MIRNIYLGILLMSLTTLASCSESSDDPKSLAELQFEKLNKEWKISSATFDGTDHTDEYKDFVLTINGDASESIYNYNITGRPDRSPWPGNGTWSFGADAQDDIVRDPGSDHELYIVYAVSDNSLTIQFSYEGVGFEGRAKSLNGDWVLTFTP